MNAPYFIEVLNPHHQVDRRYKFDALPIRIGRAYDNDLILDDAYIAPYHAEITQNEAGAIIIQDLGSKNGVLQHQQRHSSFTLNGDDLLHLGHTQIRVRSVDFAVAAELEKSHTHPWDGAKAGLFGIAMIIGSTLVSTWLTVIEQSATFTYLFAILMVLAVVLLWSGCWAFAGRVMSGQARFGRHLLIAAAGIILMDIWDVISLSAAYMFSLEIFTRYGSHIMMLIVAAMIFSHLLTIHPHHLKRMLKISAGIALLGSAIILMSNYQRDGIWADELYMSHLLPPEVRLSGNQTVDSFMQEAKTLKSVLDTERLKPAENRNHLF